MYKENERGSKMAGLAHTYMHTDFLETISSTFLPGRNLHWFIEFSGRTRKSWRSKFFQKKKERKKKRKKEKKKTMRKTYTWEIQQRKKERKKENYKKKILLGNSAKKERKTERKL